MSLQHGPDRVRHLVAPSDRELADHLSEEVEFATILIRDDVAALRYALALAHLAPSLRLAVTIFDRTIAEQLQALLPSAVVASSASAAVPTLLGPCLSSEVAGAFVELKDRVEVTPSTGDLSLDERRSCVVSPGWGRRAIRWVRVDHRHQDVGTRILLKGLLGLGLVLTADWLWLVLGAGHGPGAAFLEAARVVATVGPGPDHADGLYSIFSALAMLGTIVLTALFTAGFVDRLLEPRLVGLAGVGSVPHAEHVIVVGLGQVGLRLCEALRGQGHAVVAVERDRNASGVRLARQLKIPVVIGDGTSRLLLEQLGLRRCMAVAAVGSDDLDNVAVAVAISAISPSTRVVMRAGEQEAVAETRSLLPLGVTRDVTAVGAAYVLARLRHEESGLIVLAHDDKVHVRLGRDHYVRLPLARRDDCRHLNPSTTPHRAFAPVDAR